jgi:uncharacterized protein YdaU (DUF1376 family)
MESVRHYQRNIGDLAAATRGMTLLQRGAYDALLDAYYLSERPLPLDRNACYRLAGAISNPERDAVNFALITFFYQQDDGWHQKRCDAELARWYAKSEKARESSAIAVAVRRANAKHLATERSPDDQPNGHLPTTHDPRPITALPQPPSGVSVMTVPPAPKKAPPKPSLKPLPPGFGISDRVRAWAEEKGHTRLEERLEHFLGYVRRSGKRYVDWDEALMGAIREDWARLANKPPPGSRLSPAGQQTAAALERWLNSTTPPEDPHGKPRP